MIDLFGNEVREPRASLRPEPAPVRLSLFDHAAESSALRKGRALSQERCELNEPRRQLKLIDLDPATMPGRSPAGAYYVLVRKLRAGEAWRCALITASYGTAEALSDRMRRLFPRVPPRESAIVHSSALSVGELAAYEKQAGLPSKTG